MSSAAREGTDRALFQHGRDSEGASHQWPLRVLSCRIEYESPYRRPSQQHCKLFKPAALRGKVACCHDSSPADVRGQHVNRLAEHVLAGGRARHEVGLLRGIERRAGERLPVCRAPCLARPRGRTVVAKAPFGTLGIPHFSERRACTLPLTYARSKLVSVAAADCSPQDFGAGRTLEARGRAVCSETLLRHQVAAAFTQLVLDSDVCLPHDQVIRDLARSGTI